MDIFRLILISPTKRYNAERLFFFIIVRALSQRSFVKPIGTICLKKKKKVMQNLTVFVLIQFWFGLVSVDVIKLLSQHNDLRYPKILYFSPEKSSKNFQPRV